MKIQNKSKFTLQSKVVGILLSVSFIVSLFFRIVLPYSKVFVGDWVKFTCNDAYYHMRLVDSLVHNFPKLTNFDPYFIFPDGIVVNGARFFDWLLASVIWLVGLGSPTQHTVDVVGVYFPAVLAVLVIIPVYFIGKTLFNKWVGVISATLIAVLPGEFMGRSILGATDHHVAEVLFSTTAIMFLFLAIKGIGKRSIVYSVLAGIFFGVYLLTWSGGLIFIFIVCLYFVAQIVINHLQRKSSMHLGIVGFITFMVASATNLLIDLPADILLVMVFALLVPVVLSGLSWFMLKLKWKTVYYPLLLAGLAVIAIGTLYLIVPSTLNLMLANFSAFSGVGSTATTTMELQPFLYPQGVFTTTIAWGNFTTGFYLAPIAFVILIWMCVKHKFQEQGWLLFVLWTVVIAVLTLSQRRYAYYLAVNVALMVGFLSYYIIKLTYPKLSTKQRKLKKKANYTGVVLAIVGVFLVVVLPNIFVAKNEAVNAPFAPSNDWMLSLEWLKNNTPEPFHGSDIYYKYQTFSKAKDYPKLDYGVTAWWDYGYWITRIAHRTPSANPSQNPVPIKKVANLFLSQDEVSAERIMDELGSKYVILDSSMTTSKFYALEEWAGQPQDKCWGYYYVSDAGQAKLVQLFYPEYYQSLCVRLYNFDGKSIVGEKPVVITYSEQVNSKGMIYRLITGGQEFPSYQEALDYLATLKSGNSRIVGVNPFTSPIGIQAVSDYNLIYTSPNNEVKIFQYTNN